jgi:hypothetical protein
MLIGVLDIIAILNSAGFCSGNLIPAKRTVQRNRQSDPDADNRCDTTQNTREISLSMAHALQFLTLPPDSHRESQDVLRKNLTS